MKIFADGAVVSEMKEMHKQGIAGFTTNPTLMKKAGITDYRLFAEEVLKVITDVPISFEVFSDDFEEMEQQALLLSSLGTNVNVKIPITNTKGEYSYDLIERLTAQRVKVNVTAIFTPSQVVDLMPVLNDEVYSIVSVFAGRIADTGLDPVPLMLECARIVSINKSANLLWASPREALNILQAREAGCDIITATPTLIKKMELFGKSLDEFSLETVKMFYDDAQAAGYKL